MGISPSKKERRLMPKQERKFKKARKFEDGGGRLEGELRNEKRKSWRNDRLLFFMGISRE